MSIFIYKVYTYVHCRDMFCAGRVPEEDLKRTMQACGGCIQSTVASLEKDDKVLGSCALFEEKQIGGDRCVRLTGRLFGYYIVVVWLFMDDLVYSVLNFLTFHRHLPTLVAGLAETLPFRPFFSELLCLQPALRSCPHLYLKAFYCVIVKRNISSSTCLLHVSFDRRI